MDAASRLQLDTLLHLLLYPTLALVTAIAIGLTARRQAVRPERPGVLAVALGAAMAVAWVGTVAFPAFPPVDTRDYTPFFALLLPLPFVALEGRPRLGLLAPLAAVTIVFMLVLYLRPVLGGEYAPESRVAAGAALMLAVWIGVDRLASVVPTPAILAAFCFGSLGAAAASALSGVAVVGQALGGMAAVSGVAALVTWRIPRLTAGRGAVAALLVPFFGALNYAHYYGELPAGPAAIAALAPLAAAVALPLHRVVPATLLAGIVALLPAGAAALYAKHLSDQKHAADATEDGGTTPDYSILK